MIWQPEFTDKTLSRKPGAVQRTYFSNVCADFEAELVEMDGEPDHVHLLINYPPKLAISSLVNSLKGVSGR